MKTFDVEIQYKIEAENIEEARDAIIYGEDKPIGKTLYQVSDKKEKIEWTEEN